MFEQYMKIRDGEKVYQLELLVGPSAPLPMVFQFWMAEVARDFLRLGVLFRAVGIMLQIPGAAEYQWYNEDEDKDDQTVKLVSTTDQNALLNVLAQCLDRLGVKHLMEQVPAPDYHEEELSEEWKEMLDKREKVKNGLLTVVADCLDVLVVYPGRAEIDEVPEEPWWNRWRAEAR
ncbi:MAG: hypothetical protein JSU86_08430 [Phycisphaerales bacterium]|nr:MAG: hypothetical protein JSU86_08430 [Phycisphaerales bacterium]